MTTETLTQKDLANYTVTFADQHAAPRVIRAAYTDTKPGWLLLKDHEHRIVAQIHHNFVLMVERG